MALILYYLGKEPSNFDEFGKYWKYIEELTGMQILPVAKIPLAFK